MASANKGLVAVGSFAIFVLGYVFASIFKPWLLSSPLILLLAVGIPAVLTGVVLFIEEHRSPYRTLGTKFGAAAILFAGSSGVVGSVNIFENIVEDQNQRIIEMSYFEGTVQTKDLDDVNAMVSDVFSTKGFKVHGIKARSDGSVLITAEKKLAQSFLSRLVGPHKVTYFVEIQISFPITPASATSVISPFRYTYEWRSYRNENMYKRIDGNNYDDQVDATSILKQMHVWPS